MRWSFDARQQTTVALVSHNHDLDTTSYQHDYLRMCIMIWCWQSCRLFFLFLRFKSNRKLARFFRFVYHVMMFVLSIVIDSIEMIYDRSDCDRNSSVHEAQKKIKEKWKRQTLADSFEIVSSSQQNSILITYNIDRRQRCLIVMHNTNKSCSTKINKLSID
jgi:hypothetical protein